MSRKVTRRKFMAGTAAGAVAATFKFPAPAIAQAAPFKLGLLTVKTGPLAQGGIQMEQGVLTYPEGKGLHARRPQGRVHLRRHRRQPGRHQDQGAGAGRARQGRRHPRAARRLRTARDHRLYRAAEDAAAQPRCRRGHDAATPEPVFPARLGHAHRRRCTRWPTIAAKELKLKRMITIVRGLCLRLRADGRIPADLRG